MDKREKTDSKVFMKSYIFYLVVSTIEGNSFTMISVFCYVSPSLKKVAYLLSCLLKHRRNGLA